MQPLTSAARMKFPSTSYDYKQQTEQLQHHGVGLRDTLYGYDWEVGQGRPQGTRTDVDLAVSDSAMPRQHVLHVSDLQFNGLLAAASIRRTTALRRGDWCFYLMSALVSPYYCSAVTAVGGAFRACRSALTQLCRLLRGHL